jgi:hypothetical protein
MSHHKHRRGLGRGRTAGSSATLAQELIAENTLLREELALSQSIIQDLQLQLSGFKAQKAALGHNQSRPAQESTLASFREEILLILGKNRAIEEELHWLR